MNVVDSDCEPLVLFGQPSEVRALDWAWVDEQLTTAGAYWVAPRSRKGHPLTRPVWGVWRDDSLYLSIGSPTINAALRHEQLVTVHLGSSTDVVIVEGAAVATTEDADVLADYNTKYEWGYTIEEHGPFTKIAPSKIMAWQSGGWAGRDGFQATGRWTVPAAGSPS